MTSTPERTSSSALVTLAGSMERWFDAVCDELSADEYDAVPLGTACAVYGLDA